MSENEFEDLTSLLDEEVLPAAEGKVAGPGSEFPDFELTLPDGNTLKVSSFVQNGPAIINFIKGTWCPFCLAHMKNLLQWRASISGKKVALLTVTNEPRETVKTWLEKNTVSFTLASVGDPNVYRNLGLTMPKEDFSRPATFVVEPKDGRMFVRFAHRETRGPKLREALSKAALPMSVVWPMAKEPK